MEQYSIPCAKVRAWSDAEGLWETMEDCLSEIGANSATETRRVAWILTRVRNTVGDGERGRARLQLVVRRSQMECVLLTTTANKLRNLPLGHR